MNYFLDTSALIKRYIQEKETEAVRRIFEESTEIYVFFLSLDFKNIPIVVYDEKLYSSALKESNNALMPTV